MSKRIAGYNAVCLPSEGPVCVADMSKPSETLPQSIMFPKKHQVPDIFASKYLSSVLFCLIKKKDNKE